MFETFSNSTIDFGALQEKDKENFNMEGDAMKNKISALTSALGRPLKDQNQVC